MGKDPSFIANERDPAWLYGIIVGTGQVHRFVTRHGFPPVVGLRPLAQSDLLDCQPSVDAASITMCNDARSIANVFAPAA